MISRRAWFLIVALVVAYSIGVAFDLSPYLRGPQEWRWQLAAIPHWDQLWPIASALILIAAFVIWIDRRLLHTHSSRSVPAFAIGVLMLSAAGMQLLALRAERNDPFAVLFDRSVDVAANGYFTVGTRISDVNDFLRNYPALMPTFPIHPQVHPPGVPLLYWVTGSLLQTSPSLARAIGLWFRSLECNDVNLMLLTDPQLGSAVVGMFLPLFANMLTVWCIFKLAQHRFGNRAGLFAAAFWTIVPSAVLFASNWSQVYPCLACLTWLSVDRGLAQRKARWFLIAGLLMSIASFMELGTAALGLSLTLFILADYLIARRNLLHDWKFLSSALIAGLVGVFSIWIVYQAIDGVSLIQIIQTMLPIHMGYEFDRLTWIFNHPYEFSTFLGLGFAGLLIFFSIRSIRQAKNGQADPLTLSLGFSLLVLSIVDPARDETARTWMIFMPLAIVVVSQLAAEPMADVKHFGIAWTLVGVQLLVMIARLQVIQVGLYGQPPRSTVSAMPSDALAVQADFGGMAELIGYQIEPSALDHLTLDLYWKAIGQIDRPYVVFNHVLDAQGQILAQQDSRPQNGQPLMTCWQPGELFFDRHVIPIDLQSASSGLGLELGLYDAASGLRVPVGIDGLTDDRVILKIPQHN